MSPGLNKSGPLRGNDKEKQERSKSPCAIRIHIRRRKKQIQDEVKFSILDTWNNGVPSNSHEKHFLDFHYYFLDLL